MGATSRDAARARTTSAPSALEGYRVPVVLGVGTAVGLVSALVGDGAFDVVSWVCLGAPVAVVLAALFRSRAPR